MKNRKIFVSACVHGNEVFGLKVLAHLQNLQNPNITIRVAHLEAVAKKKRFIETDLNRSFAMIPKQSLEASIAQDIKDEINVLSPDLIIDLHTSTVKVSRVAILADNNLEVIDASKHLGMKYIAVMPTAIASQSLIGIHPEKSICVELGKGLRSDALAQELANNINNLTRASLKHSATLPLLNIDRLISKEEAEGLILQNYTFSTQLQGFPFLTGEDNYKEHRGFLATSQIKV
jgi:succinylglutamate desuccinylase